MSGGQVATSSYRLDGGKVFNLRTLLDNVKPKRPRLYAVACTAARVPTILKS